MTPLPERPAFPETVDLPALDELEIAAGWLPGYVDLPWVEARGQHPVDALRDSIRAALHRPPCVVSFSGGRDSSIVLALAADTARREGLEPPIALTFEYPGDSDAEETEHQETVLRHLAESGHGIEWERVPIHDEFDLLGPLVAPVVKASGRPLWPASLGPTVALATRASGGSVLTGEFGDEITGPQRMTYLHGVVRRRGKGLGRHDWQAAAGAALPRAVAARFDRSILRYRPWLTRQARDELLRRHRADVTRTPLFWDRSVRTWMGRRAADVGRTTIDLVGRQYGCASVHPLGDPDFVVSFAEFGGRIGLPSRSAATRLLSADLLPESVVRRRSKSTFNTSRFGPVTREFAATWDGSGVNPDLVDVDVLASMWREDRIGGPSALLLHQVWLAETREEQA